MEDLLQHSGTIYFKNSFREFSLLSTFLFTIYANDFITLGCLENCLLAEVEIFKSKT